MSFKKIIMTLIVLSFSQLSFGLDLKQARMKGFVTEMETGYLKGLNPEATDLVIEVNKKRKKYYMKISTENGATVKEVASRAAAKLQEKHNKKEK
jgi:uncharacterized protein YdbL (DUF1318 family)